MLRPSLLALALLVLAGCGGNGGGKGTPAAKGVTITAPNGDVRPGATLALTAVVNGGGTVTWSVDGGDANGTVTPGGVYTAPTTQGTYTVRATVGGVSGTKTISVSNGVSIALTTNATPPPAIPKSKLTFAAAVTGTQTKTVTWTAKDATGAVVAGLVATDGTFTAPDATGTYTVTATSVADAQKSVSATVQVLPTVNVRIAWTAKANLVLALRPDKAPITCANFVTLVNKGFYNGIQIHRKETGSLQLFQFGDPQTITQSVDAAGIGSGGPGYSIPFEVNDLSNLKYTLGMARSQDKDSGGSQVYVNLQDETDFDHREDDPATPEDEFFQGYVVFGEVTAKTRFVADQLVKGDRIVTATSEAP